MKVEDPGVHPPIPPAPQRLVDVTITINTRVPLTNLNIFDSGSDTEIQFKGETTQELVTWLQEIMVKEGLNVDGLVGELELLYAQGPAGRTCTLDVEVVGGQ